MQIHVKFGEPLWRTVGRRRVALDMADDVVVTVGDVLARLAAAYPYFASAYAGAGLVQAYPYRVFVDAVPVIAPRRPAGRSAGDYAAAAQAAALATPIHHGQTVFILLPAAGG